MRCLKQFIIILCFIYMAITDAAEEPIGLAGAPSPEPTHLWYWRTSGAPLYQTPGENFQFYLAGYGQGDAMALQNAAPLHGDVNWRSTRIDIGATIYKNWGAFLSYDFAAGRLYNAYVGYDNNNDFLVLLGQFSPIFGLQNTTDTPYITFFELPLPVLAYSTPYVPGLQMGFYHSPFAFYASVFGPTFDSTVHGRTPYGVIGTAVFSPIHTDTRVFHVGISGWQQSMDSSHILTISAQPELFAANQGTIISAGPIDQVIDYQTVDAAIAGVYGPFTLQSEYVHSWVNRSLHLPSPQFAGYYISLDYFLTGESRLYSFKNASFVGVTMPFKGRHGAWEIATQFSDLSLQNNQVLGGREHNYTVGLNWYPTEMVEFLTMYVHAVATPNSQSVNQTANLYALRFQLVF